MNADPEDLITRLEQGPAYLLLGQKHLLLETGKDPLAGPVARAVSITSDADDVYRLLQRIPSERKPAALQALKDASSRLAIPEWLQVVSELPWNGVLTTAVDSLLIRALRSEWREVQPVGSSEFRPIAPRSSVRVQSLLLFGDADQPPGSQPPTNRRELGARRAEARALAKRLPDELITPRGVVVIEAWSLDDWFDSEDLYGILHGLGRAQAHLFSATEVELEDEFIAAAIDEKVLVPHEEDLATFIEEAKARGRLTAPQRFSSGRHQIQCGLDLHDIPTSLWNSVSAFGQIMEIDLLSAPPVQSDERRYLIFREFLGTSEPSSYWPAIGSSLVFQRNYENSLRTLVDRALEGRSQGDPPFLLIGQTGTGKTVALASLAYAVAGKKQYAVMHIPRRASRPSYEVIDAFCAWVEGASIPATLLVWDGMLDPDEYSRLKRYLDSRGRRTVLVGTCYFRKESGKKNRKDDRPKNEISAPARLTSNELDRFERHLEGLGIFIQARDRTRILRDNTFLSALYRLLPDSRGAVSKGLVLELRHAETTLTQSARDEADYRPPTAMASALHAAGLIDKLELALREAADQDDAAEFYRGPYEKLVHTVLIASRHGQPIPLNLALRVAGRDGVQNLPHLLNKIDLIEWGEDHNGNYTLSARNELEARVLVEAERITNRAEFETLADVLSFVRPDSTTFGGEEVQFAVDLLARIGPRGDEDQTYSEYYLLLADAIADANSRVGVPSPRLALLETNLYREWVKFAQRTQSANSQQRSEVLLRAVEVVEDALEHTHVARQGARTGLAIHSSLLVEQASVVGSQLYELLHSGPDGTLPSSAPTESIMEMLDRVVQITARAMRGAQDEYYPVDVLCWVTIELTKQKALPEADSADLIAECVSRLLLIDVADLSPRQEAKYNSRFADIAALADEAQIAEERLQRLAAIDEPLAAYLYALRVSGLIRREPHQMGVRKALEFLQTHPAAYEDKKCLRLLVDLFWLDKTGYRFMAEERLTLPLTKQNWLECLELANLLSSGDDLSALRVEFMRALAQFHLGEFSAAFNSFRNAERESHTSRRRIVNVYLASDTSGRPRKFRPTVQHMDQDHRKGQCWVSELSRTVPFQSMDFSDEELRKGLALPEAHLAFNLRGPILEPAREPGDRRGPKIISQPQVAERADRS
ncbi:hypothetical protein LO762_03855 [Actinocorallia sp. API 0066]|uniref:P-loop NTPase n=1 Tax=Actinocorallia sp. API 0066 TaxID=2896846 RepID=UPI001E5149C1|nr:hypothetical protein [Actinocorallia sp. API 0066]MCD0448334.1 hypothetical protein [Actinocorallia sp. API 0066]